MQREGIDALVIIGGNGSITSDREIKNIKEYVPQALNGIAHLMIAAGEAGRAVAFMGIEDGTLEMLFISPEEREKGSANA